MSTTRIGIIMGSDSDHETMKHAETILQNHEIPYEIHVVSAHRTPERMVEYAKNAKSRGIEVIIAGAGGAAPHLAPTPKARARPETEREAPPLAEVLPQSAQATASTATRQHATRSRAWWRPMTHFVVPHDSRFPAL